MDFYEHFWSLPFSHVLKEDVYNEGGLPIEVISHTSKVNLFVGANNSGKSLLMREILKSDLESETLSSSNFEDFNRALQLLEEELLRHFGVYIRFNGNAYTLEKSAITEIFKKCGPGELIRVKLNSINGFLADIQRNTFHTATTRDHATGIGDHLRDRIQESVKIVIDKMAALTVKYTFLKKVHRIYIPTLRTLRILVPESNVCEKLTRQEYDLDANPSINAQKPSLTNIIVENGESFYKNAFHLRNSEYEGEVRMENFQTFLSENFFENKKVKIITDATNKVIKIKIGNEKEQPIQKLGDGLQMAIILTFPLFNYESGFLFIEEPELFLHPGFQRKIIDIFCNSEAAENFKIFIVTHSNHILDSAIQESNASVFSLKKFGKDGLNSLPKFQIRLLQYGDNNILTSLGVANSSVFLSNCSLWVEGITDRLYLKKMIQEYLKSPSCKVKYRNCTKYQEGISYSFIFSGGDNIIHYEFSDELFIKDISKKVSVKYLCKNSLAIVDNDDDKNIVRKRQLKSQLGFNFFELPVIEIESLLGYDTIIQTVKSFPSWQDLDLSKHSYIAPQAYQKKRLGSLVDDEILKTYTKAEKKGRKSFKASPTNKNKVNLTLNCKFEFCENSLPFIKADNLTPSAIKCVEKILDFVIAHN